VPIAELQAIAFWILVAISCFERDGAVKVLKICYVLDSM